MSVNVRTIRCTPTELFSVLADGWLFPVWVVGASRMRAVDDAWPAVGAKLHHSFGIWPALINDDTTMLEWDPPRHLHMQPKGWPMGEASVTIDVKDHADGCKVRITEKAVAGPASFIPHRLLDIALYQRNIETLRRLAFIAEGHTHASSQGVHRREGMANG